MSDAAKLMENKSLAAVPAAKNRERGLLGRVLGSGGLLTGSRVGAKILALATMSILAHQLSEHEMGIAMSLLAGVALVEMLGEIGFDQRLLQLDEREASEQLPSVQSVLLLRGLGASVLLGLIAHPLGVAFGFGNDRLAFLTVALVPLVRSFRNVQIVIRQRRLDFRAFALAEILPEIAAIAALFPIMRIFDGYQAIVAVTYLRAGVLILVSHVLAETPYRLGWNPTAVKGLLNYGWPLTLNGLLIYGSIQGDRLIVASAFDMASMAGFSLAATYAFLPSLAVNSLLQRLFLPLLVGQEDERQFDQRYRVVRSVSTAAALCFFAAFLLIGQSGVEFLLSDKYEGIYPLILIMALAAGIRTLRASLVIPLLATGQTRIVLWGSLARCAGLVIAIALAIWMQDLLWIAAAAIAGELFALVVSVIVIRRSSLQISCSISREIFPFVASVCLLASARFFVDSNLPLPMVSGLLFACLVFYFVKSSFKELKRLGAA